MIRGICLAFFALAVLSSPALAGTKTDATVKVNNDETETFLVVANPSTAFIAKVTGGTATAADFIAAGGQQIVGGASGTFKVKAGTVNLYFVPIVNGVPSIANFFTTTVTATKNQTTTVNISTI